MQTCTPKPLCSRRFIELEADQSRREHASPTEPTAGRKLGIAVERVAIRALRDADSSLRLGENASLSVVSDGDPIPYPLHPEEKLLLSPRVCQKKKISFTLGRAAARLAMEQIGIGNPGPVLRGLGGEPLWGDGIVGSITHSYPWSAAVVAKNSIQFSVGIDLETVVGVQEIDISPMVCREAELAWIRQGDFQERLTIVFSAKEAVYKALYPHCRRFIDFLEVELTPYAGPDGYHGGFLASFDASCPQGPSCSVHYSRHGALVFSCAICCFPWNGDASEAESPAQPVHGVVRLDRPSSRRGQSENESSAKKCKWG